MKTKKIKIQSHDYFTSKSSSLLDTWFTILDIESRSFGGKISSIKMSFDFINDEDIINKINEVKEGREIDYDYININNNHIDMSTHNNFIVFDILNVFPSEYIINNIEYDINIVRK